MRLRGHTLGNTIGPQLPHAAKLRERKKKQPPPEWPRTMTPRPCDCGEQPWMWVGFRIGTRMGQLWLCRDCLSLWQADECAVGTQWIERSLADYYGEKIANRTG